MKVKIVNELGETLLTTELKPREFKTGSRGFSASFKVDNGGARYQTSINMVEIGSKPKS